MTKVCLVSNPFTNSLRILINNEPVDETSSLTNIMDAPFYFWCNRILDLLTDEIGTDTFELTFYGIAQERQMLKVICLNYKGQVDFKSFPLPMDKPFLQRVIELNNLIFDNGICDNAKLKANIFLVLCCEVIPYEKELLEIEAKNLFFDSAFFSCNSLGWSLNNESQKQQRIYDNKYDMVFDFSCTEANADNPVNYGGKYNFLINISSETRFKTIRNNVFVFDCKIEDLFLTVFECMTFTVLKDAFINCIQSIDSMFIKSIEKITQIEAPIQVKTENNTIEKGKSVPIEISLFDPSRSMRITNELVIKSDNSEVITSNGLQVNGINEGSANLMLYIKGAQNPIKTIHYTVVKRNRINEISLHEEVIRVGVNDNYYLGFDVYPTDADNKDSIEWQSDNKNIATVTRAGVVHGISEGRCTLICSAENISQKCTCFVLPFLQSLSISVPSEFIINGQVYMCVYETMNLAFTMTPKNAINAQVNVFSSDLQTVNVNQTTLTALKTGQVYITVLTTDQHVSSQMIINVITEKERKKLLKQEEKALRPKKKWFPF